MLIYKILTAEEWAEFEKSGIFKGSAADLADGFIHFSTAAQAPGTAAKHFADVNDLFILTVDSATVGESLRWAPARGGALFPHLHAALPLDRVLRAEPLPLDRALGNGARRFPAGMR